MGYLNQNFRGGALVGLTKSQILLLEGVAKVRWMKREDHKIQRPRVYGPLLQMLNSSRNMLEVRVKRNTVI